MAPSSVSVDDARAVQARTIVVVDVETTGLSPAMGDRVCEVAAIRRAPGQPAQRYQSLVDPGRSISPGAFAVNGITPEMLDDAPRFAEIIEELESFLTDGVFVAHNAPFDLGFLQSEFALCGRSFEVPGVLDTRVLAKRLLRLPSNSLASVARHFRVPQPQAHRALADCETTLSVLDALLRVAENGDNPDDALITHPPAPSSQAGSFDSLPDDLADLLRRTGTIEIVYLTAQRSRSRRVIRDAHVVEANGQVYLNAYCTLRDDVRSFRLDRVVEWRPVSGNDIRDAQSEGA